MFCWGTGKYLITGECNGKGGGVSNHGEDGAGTEVGDGDGATGKRESPGNIVPTAAGRGSGGEAGIQ